MGYNIYLFIAFGSILWYLPKTSKVSYLHLHTCHELYRRHSHCSCFVLVLCY